MLGLVQVAVRYQTQEMQLPPMVALGEKPVLLGRNWLEKWKLHGLVHHLCIKCLLWRISLLSMKPSLRRGIDIHSGAQPIFLKARPVPCALKEKVEQELQRLEDEGIIYKVTERTGPPQ